MTGQPALSVRAPAEASIAQQPYTEALDIQGVARSFAGVRALDAVSFAVSRGTVCGIIGPNGAGKSTLLNIINGVYQADAGVVSLFGTRFVGGPRRAAELGVARTFQNIALFKGLSVVDNLIAGQRLLRRSSVLEQALGLPRARSDAAEQRARAEEILNFLHLTESRDRPVGELPYGVQKRVELGRALVGKPRLLLLDEPMAGMSALEKDEMCGFIRNVRDQRETTVVLIEHDLVVVMGLSDQLVVLDYGRLIANGLPREVAANQRVIDAYLGASS